MRTAKPKSKKKTRIVSDEVKRQRAAKREQRKHRDQIRTIFLNAGFAHIADAEGKDFDYKGARSDFDDIFVYENVIIIAEYTNSSTDKIEAHLLKKNFVYQIINGDQQGFVAYLRDQFPSVTARVGSIFNDDQIKVICLYCSRQELKEGTRSKVSGVKFLDYVNVMYFKAVTGTVKKSSRYELLDFLGVSPSEFGLQIVRPQSTNMDTYNCSVLPEANSHFPAGYKIISFYVDADALLKRTYVLRKEGWRTGGNIYQRMIDRKKVDAIRRHLIDNKGVFINNIIVTLPNGTKLLDNNKDTINTKVITKTTSGTVQLSTDFNSIGIIDGQHRVFSYHEGGAKDDEVAKLRAQQNLLVTGIMFPPGLSEHSKAKFEARLFLDINSNQSNAPADLKQEIGLILKPFAPESIARKVLKKLNTSNGALEGEFQRFYWEKDKIRTTTIVSYGLIPLVRLEGAESIFNAWNNNDKDQIAGDEALLDQYIDFCAREISLFVSSVKAAMPKERWTADRKVHDRLLTTTIINGLIVCVRKLAISSKLGDFDYYKSQLVDLHLFPFNSYKSSHYNNLGSDLASKFFGIDKS